VGSRVVPPVVESPVVVDPGLPVDDDESPPPVELGPGVASHWSSMVAASALTALKQYSNSGSPFL